MVLIQYNYSLHEYARGLHAAGEQRLPSQGHTLFHYLQYILRQEMCSYKSKVKQYSKYFYLLYEVKVVILLVHLRLKIAAVHLQIG